MWDSVSTSSRTRRKARSLCQHSSPNNVREEQLTCMRVGSDHHGIGWRLTFFACSGSASPFCLCWAGGEMGITYQVLKERGEVPQSGGIQQNYSGFDPQLPRDFQGKHLASCPLICSNLQKKEPPTMEICIMTSDFRICTEKDVCPGRMCLSSAGHLQHRRATEAKQCSIN